MFSDELNLRAARASEGFTILVDRPEMYVIAMNEIECPNCQSLNRPGANFCAMCGRRLGESGAAVDELPTEPSATDATAVAQQRRSLDLSVGHRTDVGLLRDINEDSLLVLNFVSNNNSISRPAGLFAVADGMGGHESGEIASGMLVQSLARRAAAEWLPSAVAPDGDPVDVPAWLVETIQSINGEIFESAHDGGYEMGTTVVAALIVDDLAHIAHVGDSRAYRIHAGGIERLTVDHSLVESLVLAKQISREEARAHPQGNVIYRTVGDQPHVVVDVQSVRLLPGDMLLLCSDGLSGMLTDETIHRLVTEAGAPQTACDLLVDFANQAGGEDNCTAIIIRPILSA